MKVPEGQNAVSQAVAHSAKSAIRGISGREIDGRRCRSDDERVKQSAEDAAAA